MRIGYMSVRQHSDGRFFDGKMEPMKSPEDAVRRIVSAELLFGTSVEVRPDDPRPFREVILTTKVLGTVDTTTLHFYKTCYCATALFELTALFAKHSPISVSKTHMVNRFEAAIWVRQLGARAAILVAWLTGHHIKIPETITQDDLIAVLELFLHGHTPDEINQLVV